jgi:hypothetical protein
MLCGWVELPWSTLAEFNEEGGLEEEGIEKGKILSIFW